jgi:hypothetical protein
VPSFSLAALTVLELAPPGLIDVAAACGYDHVGIRLLPATPGHVSPAAAAFLPSSPVSY